MNILSAQKLATFAASLFAKAGLDLEALHSADPADQQALANHIEQQIAARVASETESLNSQLEVYRQVDQDNTELTAQLTSATANADTAIKAAESATRAFNTLSEAITATGLNLPAAATEEDAEPLTASDIAASLKTQIADRASLQAAELLAKQGAAPLPATAAAGDPSAAPAKPELKGLDRAIAAHRAAVANN